ncbi:Protein FANTASTIC FOUR 3 [Linum perenne]
MSSSSTSCYQGGFQSTLAASEPRVLRFRFAPSSPNIIPPSSDYHNHNAAAASTGLSFLQCITTEPSYKNQQQIYSPPAASASALSKQSLEMCTESLGSETGSDDHCSSDDDQLLLQSHRVDEGFRRPQEEEEKTNASTIRRMQRRRSSGRRLQQLPPPLSSTGVQMTSRREDGRLVLTAVEASSCRAKFHAERSNGRLKLHLTTEYYPIQQEEGETEDVKTEDEKTETEEVVIGRGRCNKESGDGRNRGLLLNREQLVY